MRLFPELATCHDVSIPELLASRDERQARQRAWLTRHATPLVSFTVVAPADKRQRVNPPIFNHGVTALHTLAEEYGWTIREQAALASASRPEGLLAIDAPAQALKQATIALEQRYPLGRLWDIDVLTAEGEILSRRHFALPARRCLLCGQSAAECARGKTHALTDLLTHMEALLHDADSRQPD